MTTPCLVLTAVGTLEQARVMAHALIEGRHAACVSSIPGVLSQFRWAGEIREEPEVLLLIKTTRPRLEELKAALLQLHPYDLPEYLVLPVPEGSEPYLQWMEESTRRPEED